MLEENSSNDEKGQIMWQRSLPWLMAGCLVTAIVVGQPTSPTTPKNEKKPLVAPSAVVALAPAAVPNPGPKTAVSRITGVTLYPSSALVTREVDVPEGKGTLELTVSPLPPTTVHSSLYTEGTDTIRVIMTRYRTRAIQEDTREEVRKVRDELKQLQIARDKIESDIKTIQADNTLLGKLENFTTVTTVHSTKKGALNSESAIAMAKYIMEARSDKAKALVGYQQQLQANQDKVDVAQRKATDLISGIARTERDAVIVVEKTNAAAGKVRLNYLVNEASWSPQYKLRAGKNAKDAVQLEYLAAVIQQTGEDWQNVKLVLSTAKPMLNAAPPELQTLKVTVVPKNVPAAHLGDTAELEEQVKSLRMKAQSDFNARKQTTGIGLFNTAAAIDQSWELLNPEEAVKRGCSLALPKGRA